MFASRLLSEEQNAMPELAEAAICMRIGGFESHFCHWSVLRARNKTLRSSQTSLAAGSRRVTSVQVDISSGRPSSSAPAPSTRSFPVRVPH